MKHGGLSSIAIKQTKAQLDLARAKADTDEDNQGLVSYDCIEASRSRFNNPKKSQKRY